MLGETPPYPFNASSDHGEVSINGGLGGRLLEGNETALKTLAALPRMIPEEEQAATLRASRRALASEADRARRSFQEIRAAHFLPGTCRSCRKFGV